MAETQSHSPVFSDFCEKVLGGTLNKRFEIIDLRWPKRLIEHCSHLFVVGFVAGNQRSRRDPSFFLEALVDLLLSRGQCFGASACVAREQFVVRQDVANILEAANVVNPCHGVLVYRGAVMERLVVLVRARLNFRVKKLTETDIGSGSCKERPGKCC